MESLMSMRDEDEMNTSEITVDCRGGASSPSSDLLEDCYSVMSTEWTNEKHCLYLKSMEASFVNQLHSSMAQLHNKCDQLKTSRDVLGTGNSGGLFKYGSKSVARITKSRSRVASSWIRHYRRQDINLILQANVSQELAVSHDQEFESEFKPFLGLDNNSKQKQSMTTRSVLCCQNALGNNTEIMGQNFDGNGQAMESNLRRAKCRKNEKSSSDDNDQVVPISGRKEMRMR